MNNDFDKNAVVFNKLLVFNRPMGNENILVVFIAGVITSHKNHFRYVPLLKNIKKRRQMKENTFFSLK